MELPLFPKGGWAHYRILFIGRIFFLVLSLSSPFLIASQDLPWPPCMCQSPRFSTQGREARHIKDWYIKVFKRVKSAYTEGLGQNSIYSPPRECQDRGISTFSGMGYNFLQFYSTVLVGGDRLQFQGTLLHPYESSSSLFLGQKLCRDTAGRQPPVLPTVEGGKGENAETEESWMEPPSHQPCLTRLTADPVSHIPWDALTGSKSHLKSSIIARLSETLQAAF